MALHRINLNLPADLHSRFVATARREDRTLTVVLVRALEAYIVGSEGQPTGDKVIVQSITWMFLARSRHPQTGADSSLWGPMPSARENRTRPSAGSICEREVTAKTSTYSHQEDKSHDLPFPHSQCFWRNSQYPSVAL